MAGLTRRQQAAYDFIVKYIEEKSLSPTYAEIRDAMGEKSSSGAHRVIHSLQRRGFITFRSGMARSIEIAGRHRSADKETKMVDLVREYISVLRIRCPQFARKAEEIL